MSTLNYTTLREAHAQPLTALQRVAYPDASEDARFTEEEFHHHANLFPEGTLVVLDGDRTVGMAAGIFTDFDLNQPQHDIQSVIGDGFYANHNPHGAFYYGTEIIVHPDYRKRGIGRELYNRRKALVQRANKRGIVAGGVLPGYANHKATLGAADYVARVVAGELHDPTLSFQIANGFEVRGVLRDYYEYPRSDNWASLLVWFNPAYRPQPKSTTRKRVAAPPAAQVM